MAKAIEMSLEEVMVFLEEHGTEQYRKILTNHGISLPMFGAKVADMKKIEKKVKKNYDLSIALYDTGNYDAMYLAGLIADEKKMTAEDLDKWLLNSGCESIACTTVAWIAAESDFGHELALKWMKSDHETTAAAGWATYTSLIATKENDHINYPEVEGFLDHVAMVIHQEREEVKYQMNAFVIAAGGYMPELAVKAKAYGDRIGKVSVDMGNTACKVPLITPYIEKMEARGVKKKKKARC